MERTYPSAGPFAAALSRRANSDSGLVNELAADGSEIHCEKLADRAGIGISTLTDMLNRIPDLVKSDIGEIKFRSEPLKQEILDLIHSTGKSVEQRPLSVAYLLGVDESRWKEKGAAWEAWLEEYGVDLLKADVNSSRACP